MATLFTAAVRWIETGAAANTAAAGRETQLDAYARGNR